MTHESHFDLIIIGTGAGGGTLAYHLAASGKRILILEQRAAPADELLRGREHEILWRSAVPLAPEGFRGDSPPRWNLSCLADQL